MATPLVGIPQDVELLVQSYNPQVPLVQDEKCVRFRTLHSFQLNFAANELVQMPPFSEGRLFFPRSAVPLEPQLRIFFGTVVCNALVYNQVVLFY
jgi:hypothetical protein